MDHTDSIVEYTADVASSYGHETASMSSLSPSRESNHKEDNGNAHQSFKNAESDPLSKSDDSLYDVNTPVSLDENYAVFADGNNEIDEKHCGLLPNTCLPCLSNISSFDKTKPSSPGRPSITKKATSKLSFKRKESQNNPSLCEYRILHYVIEVIALPNLYLLWMVTY